MRGVRRKWRGKGERRYRSKREGMTRTMKGKLHPLLGLLVDKDDLIKYQLVIRCGLLVRIFTYQPTVDETIVLSTNC